LGYFFSAKPSKLYQTLLHAGQLLVGITWNFPFCQPDKFLMPWHTSVGTMIYPSLILAFGKAGKDLPKDNIFDSLGFH
jgi:hypothetical protein